MGMLTLFITSADGIKTCSVLEYKPRIHAFRMDSGLARGSTPWTPGGYIPVANMLFIPVSNILFIPVTNTLFIPVPNMLFIPVPNILFIPVPNTLFIPVSNSLFIPVSNHFFISVSHTSFYIPASIYYLAVLPALINYNSITTHLKSEPIISLHQH